MGDLSNLRFKGDFPQSKVLVRRRKMNLLRRQPRLPEEECFHADMFCTAQLFSYLFFVVPAAFLHTPIRPPAPRRGCLNCGQTTSLLI